MNAFGSEESIELKNENSYGIGSLYLGFNVPVSVLRDGGFKVKERDGLAMAEYCGDGVVTYIPLDQSITGFSDDYHIISLGSNQNSVRQQHRAICGEFSKQKSVEEQAKPDKITHRFLRELLEMGVRE